MIGVDIRISSQGVLFALLMVASICPTIGADDGYDLWMSYKKLNDATMIREYQQTLSSIVIQDSSDTLNVIREEVAKGLEDVPGITR